MKILLTFKHWQIFLLTWGPPFILSILVINPNNIPSWLNIIIAFGCIMLLLLFSFGSYIYTLGVNLYPKLPANAPMNLKKFKICFLIPALYLLQLLISFVFRYNIFPPNKTSIFVSFMLTGLSMFCMFYLLYFVAKAIVTVEKQMEVTFSSFAIEFFALWYFPIGIWLIQPRVNKIFGATNK